MRYPFFGLLILLYSGHLFSQTGGVLPTDPKALNDSAAYYHDRSNFDKAWEFALQARLRGEALERHAELYRSYALLGSIEFRRGHVLKAKQFHAKSLSAALEAGNINWRSRALSNMASMLSNLGEYDSAGMLLKEIVSFKDIDREILVSAYGRLGVNLKRQQQYDKAIGYYVKSLAISNELNDSLASARTLANIGNIYMEQKDAGRALEHYQQALSLLDSDKHTLSISGISVFASDAYQALGKYDEAEGYLNHSLALVKKLNLPASEAYALESLGILHFRRKQLKDAIATFSRALALRRTLDSWSDLEALLLYLTECYIHAHDFEKAQACLSESRQIAERHKHAMGLRNIYGFMSQLDSVRGDFASALAHHKLSVHYKDSLFTVEKAKAVEEVNRKFEAQQKGKVIESQQRIIEQQRTKETFFIMLSVVVVISGGVIYFFIQRRQRLKREMEQEQQQKQKLFAIVIAQEQMQQKIARDLHDSFVQILGAAKINLESVKALNTSPIVSAKLQETADIVDKACLDARTISHQLLPYSLEKHGLVMAIQELLDKHPKKGNEEYTFRHVAVAERFKNTIEINVYRILQELINNIIKHAGARCVQVYLSRQADRLILSVSDDGKGFDMKQTSFGAGLMNIESRLQSVSGMMRIESEMGTGTTTVIQIPLL